MTVDYDAPRGKQDEPETNALDELVARPETAPVLDVDDSDVVEGIELPGADLSGEELTVRVVPKQTDEFTCTSCFLVQHRNRLAHSTKNDMICTDCA